MKTRAKTIKGKINAILNEISKNEYSPNYRLLIELHNDQSIDVNKIHDVFCKYDQLTDAQQNEAMEAITVQTLPIGAYFFRFNDRWRIEVYTLNQAIRYIYENASNADLDAIIEKL